MTFQEFDSPSIYELYNSAKKLLLLQDRVENRSLRKENVKSQKNHILYHEGKDNYLELLSPLDYEEKVQSKKSLPISIMDITPASMNDYSPPTNNNIAYKKKNLSPVENNDISASFKNFKNSPSSRPKKLVKPKSNLTSSFHSPQFQNLSNISSPTPTATPSSVPNITTPSFPLATPQSFPSNGISNMSMSMTNSSTIDANKSNKTIECHNCQTVKTPLWRKDPNGNTLCNACGLFLKLHGTTRPLSLKTDVIKKRSSRRSTISSGKLLNSLPKSNSELSKIKFNSNHSTPISNFDMEDNEMANGPRYKNVLILPKPTSTTTTTSININGNSNGNSNITTNNNDSRSIPIPRNPSSLPHSPSSPLVNEYNQSFKRKRSNLSRKPSVTSMSSYQFSNSRKNSAISIPSLPQRNSFINTPSAISSNSFRTMNFFDKPKDLNLRQFEPHSNPSLPVRSPSIQSLSNQSSAIQSPNFETQSFETNQTYPKPEFFNQDAPQDLDWLKFEI